MGAAHLIMIDVTLAAETLFTVIIKQHKYNRNGLNCKKRQINETRKRLKYVYTVASDNECVCII